MEKDGELCKDAVSKTSFELTFEESFFYWIWNKLASLYVTCKKGTNTQQLLYKLELARKMFFYFS